MRPANCLNGWRDPTIFEQPSEDNGQYAPMPHAGLMTLLCLVLSQLRMDSLAPNVYSISVLRACFMCCSLWTICLLHHL